MKARGAPGEWLAALALALAVAAMTLAAAAVIWPADPSAGRAAGSTWSTAPAGWARLHDLLVEQGRAVTRYEGTIAELAELPEAAEDPTSLVLALAHPEPQLSTEDQERLLALVERGGTLVLATAAPLAMLEAREIALSPHPLAGPAWPALPSALTRGGGPLIGEGGAAARPVSGLAALYTSEVGVRVGALAVGEGQVILLTDTGLLSNQALRSTPSRALALSLFPPGTRTFFLERLHGFRRSRGLAVWLGHRGWGTWLACALAVTALAGWRRAAPLTPPPPAPPPAPAGLSGLARAAGRLNLSAGDHRRPLRRVVQAARARGLRDHPALAAAEAALSARRLDGARALALAVALEDAVWGAVRGSDKEA